MRQTSFAHMHCSLARSLEAIGDWWTPLILRDIYLGIDRFQDIVDDLGVSRNLLSERLRRLLEHGVIAREQYNSRPPRDRFVLTPGGWELMPILIALTAWGDRWQPPPGGAPMRFQHGDHTAEPTIACAACAEPLKAEDLTPRPGPGGRRARGTMIVAERLAQRG
jgi:DNA-binding HxlR family transcriptional regulator